jgi:organic radical activating enzyme
MSKKLYRINEWFYSIQGEGMRAGTANLFLRFSGCNLTCSRETEGFDCDTEFTSGESWTADQIVAHLRKLSAHCPWVILTGGEPSLQIDDDLLMNLKDAGFSIAIETNGTKPLSSLIDWVSCSPKTAEHTLRVERANELRYVRAYGMGLPKPSIKADHYLISPAFDGSRLPTENLEWCLKLVKENPEWRLSLQTHKFIQIR